MVIRLELFKHFPRTSCRPQVGKVIVASVHRGLPMAMFTHTCTLDADHPGYLA